MNHVLTLQLVKHAGEGWYDRFSNYAHGALETGGLVPGVGIIPDAINGLYYGGEAAADYNKNDSLRGMGLAVAQAVPFLGQGVTAAKWGAKGLNTARKINKGKGIVKGVTNGITRGATEFNKKFLKEMKPLISFNPMRNKLDAALTGGMLATGINPAKTTGLMLEQDFLDDNPAPFPHTDYKAYLNNPLDPAQIANISEKLTPPPVVVPGDQPPPSVDPSFLQSLQQYPGLAAAAGLAGLGLGIALV